MTEQHKHNVSQDMADNLDCSGAGECQPIPEETTDGAQKQNLVQKFIDKMRTIKNKKKD
ncbi:MAG: hypothetical protein IKV03_01960 [Alphaproteobacteria bacterium]|nr:hypothetical protein [Alphaproteobacteria bacterium]